MSIKPLNRPVKAKVKTKVDNPEKLTSNAETKKEKPKPLKQKPTRQTSGKPATTERKSPRESYERKTSITSQPKLGQLNEPKGRISNIILSKSKLNKSYITEYEAYNLDTNDIIDFSDSELMLSNNTKTNYSNEFKNPLLTLLNDNNSIIEETPIELENEPDSAGSEPQGIQYLEEDKEQQGADLIETENNNTVEIEDKVEIPSIELEEEAIKETPETPIEEEEIIELEESIELEDKVVEEQDNEESLTDTDLMGNITLEDEDNDLEIELEEEDEKDNTPLEEENAVELVDEETNTNEDLVKLVEESLDKPSAQYIPSGIDLLDDNKEDVIKEDEEEVISLDEEAEDTMEEEIVIGEGESEGDYEKDNKTNTIDFSDLINEKDNTLINDSLISNSSTKGNEEVNLINSILEVNTKEDKIYTNALDYLGGN